MLNQFEPDTLPPLQDDEFLPPINRWTTVATWLLVGMLTGGVGLAAAIEYNVTVQATAIVRPVNQISTVQVLSGGTIRRVLVKENHVVQQGDVIAELDVVDRTQLLRLQTRRQRLQRYIQQYQNQLAQVDTQLHQVKAQAIAQSGLLPLSESATPVKTDPSADHTPIPEGLVEAALDRLASQAPATATQLSTQRDRLQQQQIGLTNQLQYDQTLLQTLDQELSKSVILAPSDGIVFKLALAGTGQTVQPGDAIAQIVPQNSPLVVKARVNVQDISQVDVGQEAQLRISAYPYPDYGILRGTVQAIAPDITTVGDVHSGLPPYYEITIQPEQPYLEKGDRQYPLQPGMEARADIISRQETVLQSFLRKLRLWAEV
ncbi:MAG: HlyD family efflux transporter periplasmic adaptor subunit [Oscillatoriales cyanobacterium C42_A2020_001]|nr:HlyD family efflux transporter periplasmic adaptor subunit [Leptolyngbyaceae cyanobacterium C42_A2020_001]